MASPSTIAGVGALLSAGLFAPLGLSGQAGGPEAEPDSADRLAAARQAQARFESVRTHRLPWTFGGLGGACDERVGRYCVRHDRSDDDWVAPPEHRDVSEARDVLLVHLREALEHHPGDDWIIGQRVAYLLDAGRPDDALDAARRCEAERWWCAALVGLVRHARGETEEAEASFVLARSLLPPDELERWTDLQAVLSSGDARRVAALDSRQRDTLAAMLWWLADPLWMRAGNDRYTEHLSRLVRARLAGRARAPEGARWGRDMEELLLRFGWPAGWERTSSGTLERRETVITHHAAFGREFLPSVESALSPWTVSLDDWNFTPPIPATEYAPPYARFEGTMSFQLAVLPDGDSAVIAAVVAYQHDSIAPDDSMSAALVVAMPGEASVDSGPGLASRTTRDIRVARRDLVASVEAVAVGATPRAARIRLGLPLARRDSTPIVLSDPVLIDPGGAPTSREAAIARMLLPREVASADSIAVYLEAARLAPDVPVELELSVVPERSGGLRRIGESLGLVSERSAVRLAWQERPPADGRLTRAVTLGFGQVPEGRYTLHLLVRQGSAWGASWALVDRRER